MIHEWRGVGHQDLTKMHHIEQLDGKLTTKESDKRRKVSQNTDESSSKQSRHKGLHNGQNKMRLKLEEPRAKKLSLAELLSKDVAQGMTEAGQIKGMDGKRLSRDERDSKQHRSHGDNSETDSDEELQRSKVLRVRKSRAENKKDDNSLQTLLSRIINPEDDLNTLKRGKKISDLKRPQKETKTSRQSHRDNSNTGEMETKSLLVHVTETSTPRKYKTNVED